MLAPVRQFRQDKTGPTRCTLRVWNRPLGDNQVLDVRRRTGAFGVTYQVVGPACALRQVVSVHYEPGRGSRPHKRTRQPQSPLLEASQRGTPHVH